MTVDPTIGGVEPPVVHLLTVEVEHRAHEMDHFVCDDVAQMLRPVVYDHSVRFVGVQGMHLPSPRQQGDGRTVGGVALDDQRELLSAAIDRDIGDAGVNSLVKRSHRWDNRRATFQCLAGAFGLSKTNPIPV